LQDWYRATKATSTLASAGKKPLMGQTITGASGSALKFDPALIVGLANTELLAGTQPSTFYSEFRGRKVQFMRVDQSALHAFTQAYMALESAQNASPTDAQDKFVKASVELAGC
jgi:hypothetical protein